MTLGELKESINNFPKDMDNFIVVNGEYGFLNPNDENSLVYRVDKPVLIITVDKNDEEILLLHQTREDVKKLMNDGNT
jgi:NADH pyrophosphatase NudC (nudix superfamily)